MATAFANQNITQTTFAGGYVAFAADGFGGSDRPCHVYLLRNRDASNNLRAAVQLFDGSWLVDGADGGAVIPAGGTPIPFSSGGVPIAKVVLWNEGSAAAADGFVEGV